MIINCNATLFSIISNADWVSIIVALIMSIPAIYISYIANVYAYKNLLDTQLGNLANNVNQFIVSNDFKVSYSPGAMAYLLTQIHYASDILTYMSSKKSRFNRRRLSSQLVKERKDLFYMQLDSSIKCFFKDDNIDNILGSTPDIELVLKTQYRNLKNNFLNEQLRYL